MWTIHLSFVFGFMVGFEIMDPNETEGISGLCIDLGIFRVMILKEPQIPELIGYAIL